MLAQQEIVFEKNEARKAQVVECLIDDNQPGQPATGRFYGQAPHIDSICLIGNCKDSPGAFIKAKITGFENYDLLAEKI